MKWTKRIVKSTLYIAFLSLTTGLALEIVFSFLPVSTSNFIQPVNDLNPISHFKINNTVTINEQPDFSIVRYKKTNNWGYFSDYDYQQARLPNKCRTVVLGDSYVEAQQVENRETFHALLHKGACETFALGKSGDPFSQYLAYANFAIDKFDPDYLVFSIIANDFDESLLKYKSSPSSHYFNDSGELERIDFEPSIFGIVIRSSNFLYYLYNDLKLHVLLKRLMRGKTIMASSVEGGLNSRLVSREEDSRWVVDQFIQRIVEMAEKRKVLLVVDADRNLIYEGGKHRDETKVLGRLNNYLIKTAAPLHNVIVIDMQKYFWQDWVNNKAVFNSEHDYHWNAYGHSVVADTIECFLSDLCYSNHR